MGDVKAKGNKKRQLEGAMNRSLLQTLRSDLSPFVIISITTLVTIAISIYFLSAGYFNIFPNLFYIPIIIACIYYKKRGLIFSIIVACIYFLLTLVFTRESSLLLEAFVMVLIFVFVAGIVSYLSSARKHAGEALQQSEERFRQMVDWLPEAVCEFDASGNILFGNRAAFITVGYDETDFDKGLNILPMIAPEDQERAYTNIQKMMAGEALGADEYTLVRKDGSRFPAMVHIANIFNASGKTIGFRGIIVDITERRQAVEAQQRLAAIVESSHDAIIGKTLDGIITSWNKGAEERYGYHAAEVIGCSIAVIIPPDRVDELPRFLETIRRGGAVIDYESERITKDVRRVTVLLTISPIKDASGKVVGASTIAQDITERKKAEEALRESEKKYRQLIETLQEGVWAIDKDANTTFVNLRMAEILGYTVEEMLGKSLFGFMDERGVEIAKYNMERRKQGIVEQHDFEFLRKDGRRINATLETSPLTDEKGDFVGALAGVIDITERKRFEEMLKESEQKFRELADLLPQTICEIDLNGHFTYANRYGIEAHGYTKEEIEKSLNAIDLFLPAQRDRVVQNISRVLAGQPFDDHEYNVLHKDGSTYPAIIYTNSIVRDGQIVGVRALVVDITERKKIEQMKTDFVSFISHQLRTPVAGLMAYIDNMLDGITGALNDMQVDYLREMHDVCARNNRLIADLLNVSRLERGILAVNINPVDLRSVVDVAVKEYSKSIKEKGLSLNIREADQGLVVLADTDKLAEVLKNVIHNATKFNSKGSISIEIVAEGQRGIVKISDTGMGISKRALQDLFDKERVFGGTAVAGGGAGLGLYIAKGFMKLQGGDITVESAMGKGSTFIISLPRG
jgi:PAS domain S-box-containing protein